MGHFGKRKSASTLLARKTAVLRDCLKLTILICNTAVAGSSLQNIDRNKNTRSLRPQQSLSSNHNELRILIKL